MSTNPTERPKVSKVEVVVKSVGTDPNSWRTTCIFTTLTDPNSTNFNYNIQLRFSEMTHDVQGTPDYGVLKATFVHIGAAPTVPTTPGKVDVHFDNNGGKDENITYEYTLE